MTEEQTRLVGLLSALDAATRIAAAELLARRGDFEALLELHYRKLHESAAPVRDALQTAIWQLEGAAALRPADALPRLLVPLAGALQKDRLDPDEREAARQVMALVQKLAAPRPAPERTRHVPAAEPFPKDIPSLIALLKDYREDFRRRAEGALLLRGREAVKPLMAAFRTATPLQQARIAGVLAGIGETLALPTLWNAWTSDLEGEAQISLRAALLRLAAQLPTRFDEVSLETQLVLLAESRHRLPALAELIAQALMIRAHRQPTLALRAALPLLKGSWLSPAPGAFESARRAIEAATKDGSTLPLPASSPKTTGDLPRPAENESEASDLPRPSEERP